MFPMGLLASGECGEVVDSPAAGMEFGPASGGHAHRAGCRGCRCGGRNGVPGRLEDMGIRPGKTIEMLSNEGGGALLVKVDEARIAVARAMAMKIMVRRKCDEPGDA